jgi:hypothetical protein
MGHQGGPIVRTNYVLVDLENVRADSVAVLDRDFVRLMVFVGATQPKISFELAASMQRMGSRAEYVKISGIGPNALDFHIAYHIGRIAVSDPSAIVHIISKDTGFDPLVAYLKGGPMRVGRFDSIDVLPMVQVFGACSIADRVALARGRLRGMKATKPRSLKTLSSTIAALFLKQLSDEEVSAVVRGLVGVGDVVLEGEVVSYGGAIEGAPGVPGPRILVASAGSTG